MRIARPQPIRTALAAALLALSAATLAGSRADAAPAAKTKPQWQVLRGVKHNGVQPLLAVGWAANRLWIATVPRDDPVLASARLPGGKFTSLVQTRVPAELTLLPIVDGQLVFEQGSGDDRTTLAAPLLANGQVGTSEVVSDELLARGQEVAPKLAGVSILDGVRVGNRIVWALTGAEEARGIGGAPLFFLACCSESGAATDLTRFSHRRRGVFDARIGLDTRGRIWLAWGDTKDRRGALILELDRSTLAPRTKPLAVPRVRTEGFDLACAASCRLVVQTIAGDIVSWAPGERSATRVVSHPTPPSLLGASYRSGDLVVAYHDYEEIRVARGDARGARARVVGSIAATYGWPPGRRVPDILDPVIDGVFVPGGFVATEWFRMANAPPPVIAAFVPLGR